MLALLLNDASTCLLDGSTVLYDEPGIAHIERRNISIGREALEQSRLHPGNSQSFYLQKLDQDRVQRGGSVVKTQADLIYQHLLHVKKTAQLSASDSVWFVVPSDISADQLGLLYGIALRAEVSVKDFVDVSVLAAAGHVSTRDCAVIDVGLHRTTVARVNIGDLAARGQVDAVPQLGWLPLMNLWLRSCAERSLYESRFDPRKLASTEQQLFNQLYDFVRSDDERQNFALELRGTIRSLESSRSDLGSAAAERYSAILDLLDDSMNVLVSTENAKLPGLRDVLESNGHHVFEFDRTQAVGALVHIPSRKKSDDDSRTHYRKLQIVDRATKPSKDPSIVLELAESATHMLVGHTAHSLSHGFRAEPLANGSPAFVVEVTASGKRCTFADEDSVRLNGKSLSGGPRLVLGDELEVGSVRYRLIDVNDG